MFSVYDRFPFRHPRRIRVRACPCERRPRGPITRCLAAPPRTTIFFLRPLAPALHNLVDPSPCRPAAPPRPARAVSCPQSQGQSRNALMAQRLGGTLSRGGLALNT